MNRTTTILSLDHPPSVAHHHARCRRPPPPSPPSVSLNNCIEVTGSHVGLIFNRKAYRAIATALAKPELR